MISIIFVALNEEACIAQTIQSLKSRLTFPHEIIVSDGHSDDRTVEIAEKYADKVVRHRGTRRQTIAQGRNAGARAATGDFLVFMDADSRIPDPDPLFTRALAQFKAHPDLVALTARLRVYPADETLADRLMFGILNFNLRLMNNLFHRGESTGEFQMMPRRAFNAVGGFREDLVTREDADMFLRLSRIGRTRLDPGMTVYHSARRAHRLGWPRLLCTWMLNTLWVLLFDHARAREWEVVR
ncbi:MAG: glycosyltransferase [Verrucomicrobia bacterium]|nr:glycosyltransferase [Verrucomicrobiota bacterium]MDE3099806.1 glycosyltransferase [Verrucomicrobiota bacterium]